MVAKVQLAADIIWSNGTEHRLTSDLEADLVFCGLNLATLFPAALTTSLTQRPMMLLDTGWNSKSLQCPLKSSVRVKYSCSDHTWVGPAEYEVNLTDFTLGLVSK